MTPIGEEFQAGRAEDTLLVLFIPSADREGASIGKKEQRSWVRRALKLLGKKLRGGTAFPRGWGVWRDDAQGGRLVWDRAVLIQCFTSEDALRQNEQELRDFMIELGTETNQGAIGCVIDRVFYELAFPAKGS
jgi:hypothetical protein